MTPYELGIALHYHTSGVDYPWLGAPIAHQTKEWFVDNELLFHSPATGSTYYPTEKLHAFCRMLCAVPLPVQCWTDPRTGAVVKDQWQQSNDPEIQTTYVST